MSQQQVKLQINQLPVKIIYTYRDSITNKDIDVPDGILSSLLDIAKSSGLPLERNCHKEDQTRSHPILVISCKDCGNEFFASVLSKEHPGIDPQSDPEGYADIVNYAKAGHHFKVINNNELSLQMCDCNP
jgi:hypothetical protein